MADPNQNKGWVHNVSGGGLQTDVLKDLRSKGIGYETITEEEIIRNETMAEEVNNIKNESTETKNKALTQLDVGDLAVEGSIGEHLHDTITKLRPERLDLDPIEDLLSSSKGLMNNDFSIVDWGVKDYLNERADFQKGLGSMLGEPTWFYFKIFFKFNTKYGLFGNIMRGDAPTRDNTSAERYLSNIRMRYYQEQPANRRSALIKFVRTLSFISCKAPWMFFSVKDLNNTLVYDLSKAGAPKTITLEFLQDAIDMRLTTLFDLYRYAAYDFAHDKEIIPENLRKFDMDIVLFQIPIKYLQTSIKTMVGRKAFYKSLANVHNYGEVMSYQLFTFQNCEFDINSFSSLIPSSMNNDKAFGLRPSIKIFYDKCYHHTWNEFTQFLVGDSRYLFFGGGEDQLDLENAEPTDHRKEVQKILGDTTYREGSQQNRIRMLQYGIDNKQVNNKSSNNYNALVEASEDIIGESLRMIAPKVALGNLYQQSDWDDLWNNTKDTVVNIYDNFVDQWKVSKQDFKDYLGFKKDEQKFFGGSFMDDKSLQVRGVDKYRRDRKFDRIRRSTAEEVNPYLEEITQKRQLNEAVTKQYMKDAEEDTRKFQEAVTQRRKDKEEEIFSRMKQIFNPADLRKQWEEEAKEWKKTHVTKKPDNLYKLMRHSNCDESCGES